MRPLLFVALLSLAPVEAHFPKWLSFKPPFHFSEIDKKLVMMGKAEFAVNVYDKVLEGNALRLRKDEIEQAGQVFIQAASVRIAILPADKQARAFGVCGLRNLAESEENQQAMWEDRKVRRALLNSATLRPNHPADIESINCALDAYALLATDPVNRKKMWICPAVRKIIVKRAMEPADNYELRATALSAMSNMANNTMVAVWMWADVRGARKAILTGARLSASAAEYQVTQNALLVLVSMASEAYVLRKRIWKDYRAYKAIYKAVSWDTGNFDQNTLSPQKNAVRAAGLNVLSWIVLHPCVAKLVYDDKIMCWIIQSAVPPSQWSFTGSDDRLAQFCEHVGIPNTVFAKAQEAQRLALAPTLANETCFNYTQRALETLNGLALNCQVSGRMWNTVIKNITLEWSYTTGCDLCRQWAISTVANVAHNPEHREEVWYEGGGEMCINVTEKRPDTCDSVRFLGFNCLWELAGGNVTKGLIWQNETAMAQITDATTVYGNPMPSMIRSISFGVLWRLTTCPFIANATWLDNGDIRANVVDAAARLTAPGSILTRTFALGIMYQWSQPVLELGPEMWETLRIRETVFSVALETTIWKSNAQAQALGILHNWALQHEEMKIALWQDRDGAREVLLRIANNDAPQQEEARVLAMCSLQELTQAPANKDAMWDNSRSRETFNTGALDKHNKISQECAIAAFGWLATVEANAVEMWATNETREALLTTAGCSNPFRAQAQRLAVGVLQILAMTPDNREPIWFSPASCLMIQLADPSLFSLISDIQSEIRATALAVLWTLALNVKVRHRMFWDKFGTMRVLALAAASKIPSQLRAKTFALATYSNLARSDDLRVLMWFSPVIRKIVVCAAKRADSCARSAAMAVLWQLSFNEHLKRPIWRCRKTRHALIDGANDMPTVDSKVRLYSLYTIRNIAEARVNMICMWKNDALRTALIRTLDDQGSRAEAFGLAAIQILAFSRVNQHRMWNEDYLLPPPPTPEPFRERVVAVADRDCPDDELNRTNVCWHARQWAIATVELWSRLKCNRASMFQNQPVTNMIGNVCAATWTDSGPGTIARTYSLETLSYLSTDPDAARELWNDPTERQNLVDNCAVPNSELPQRPPTARWTRCRMGEPGTETLVPRAFIELEALGGPALERVVKAGGTVAALDVLANMAEEMDQQVLPNMWDEYETSIANPPAAETAAGNCVAACKAEDPRLNPFRASGCRCLANMAETTVPGERAQMWAEDDFREALIAAGQEHPQYEMDEIRTAQWEPGGILNDVRREGIRGLANLAEDQDITKSIWLDAQGARLAFELGGRIDPTTWQEGCTRSQACRGFRNLAEQNPTTNEDVRTAIWRNAEVRETIMDAAKNTGCKNKKARMFCMSALNMLSQAQSNQAQMWAGAEAINTQRQPRSRRLGQPSAAKRPLALAPPPREDDGGEAWARLAGFL